MSPSTASNNSLCLTLALITISSSASALDNSLAGVGNHCDSCSSIDKLSSASLLESTTITKRLPIHLQPHLLALSGSDDDDDFIQRNNNASAYYSELDEDEEEFELPAELAAMIADAKLVDESSPASAPTLESTQTMAEGIRHYATYSEGKLCSSKSSTKFDSWEESYASLDDCCEGSFSWDYKSCMGSL